MRQRIFLHYMRGCLSLCALFSLEFDPSGTAPELSVPNNCALMRSGSNGRGRVGRLDDDEAGFVADLQSIVGLADHTGAGFGGHMQCNQQVFVCVEARAVAHQHGTLQHIAVSVWPPGVLNVVVAGEYRHAASAQAQDGREHMIPRRIGHDRNTGGAEHFRDVVNSVRRDIAQSVCVAHRDSPEHAQNPGARCNTVKLSNTGVARFVKVDVNLDTVFFSDAEDDVELAICIAIQCRRVYAAYDLRTFADGRVKNVSGTGAGHHAGLGKRHEFNIDQVLPFLARFHHSVQIRQSHCGVHVNVTAHGDRAKRGGLPDQRVGAFSDWQCRSKLSLLDRQTFAQD